MRSVSLLVTAARGTRAAAGAVALVLSPHPRRSISTSSPSFFVQKVDASTEATPFVLLCHVKVHHAMVPDYLAWAKQIDNTVKETEPGMLYHSLDQHPTEPTRFCWTELYRDDAALLFHFDNPPVIAAMGDVADAFYEGPMEILIYG
jgi:quinol monooxygenase YgiN